jgi:hypothetical protein
MKTMDYQVTTERYNGEAFLLTSSRVWIRLVIQTVFSFFARVAISTTLARSVRIVLPYILPQEEPSAHRAQL